MNLTSTQILNSMGTAPTFGFLFNEVGEVAEAASRLAWGEVVDELSDCAFFFWALVGLAGLTVTALGALRAWRKVEQRRLVWVAIFESHGLVYHARYTKGGTNYRKAHKVEAALEMARAEQL